MAKLAVNGGKSIREKAFPSWPIFGDAERGNLLEVFENGRWRHGEKVKEFEKNLLIFKIQNLGLPVLTEQPL